MRLKQQLLDVSAAYCVATGLSEARVSTRVFRHGGRLKGLRNGRGMLSDNVEDALQWFSDQWPEGAQWPCDVPRPAPAPSDGDPSPEGAPAP